MIGWIIGIVTLILLLFVLWQRASKAFRDRAEEPKFLFLENLGISPPRRQSPDQPQKTEEKNDESAHP
jgi:hypothetical protein